MRMITAAEVFSRLPQREADTNKGSYGSVAAVAGSLAYRGAAALCCEAALRGGAGLVYLASVEPVVQLVLARTPECCALPCRTDGDGGVRSYPLFSLGQGQDFFPAVTRQKHFAPGDILTVYKSPKGRFSLEPEPLDYLLIPIALLPVFFVGLFVLCLLVTGAFLLGTGVAGLAASL